MPIKKLFAIFLAIGLGIAGDNVSDVFRSLSTYNTYCETEIRDKTAFCGAICSSNHCLEQCDSNQSRVKRRFCNELLKQKFDGMTLRAARDKIGSLAKTGSNRKSKKSRKLSRGFFQSRLIKGRPLVSKKPSRKIEKRIEKYSKFDVLGGGKEKLDAGMALSDAEVIAGVRRADSAEGDQLDQKINQEEAEFFQSEAASQQLYPEETQGDFRSDSGEVSEQSRKLASHSELIESLKSLFRSEVESKKSLETNPRSFCTIVTYIKITKNIKNQSVMSKSCPLAIREIFTEAGLDAASRLYRDFSTNPLNLAFANLNPQAYCTDQKNRALCPDSALCRAALKKHCQEYVVSALTRVNVSRAEKERDQYARFKEFAVSFFRRGKKICKRINRECPKQGPRWCRQSGLSLDTNTCSQICQVELNLLCNTNFASQIDSLRAEFRGLAQSEFASGRINCRNFGNNCAEVGGRVCRPRRFSAIRGLCPLFCRQLGAETCPPKVVEFRAPNLPQKGSTSRTSRTSGESFGSFDQSDPRVQEITNKFRQFFRSNILRCDDYNKGRCAAKAAEVCGVPSLARLSEYCPRICLNEGRNHCQHSLSYTETAAKDFLKYLELTKAAAVECTRCAQPNYANDTCAMAKSFCGAELNPNRRNTCVRNCVDPALKACYSSCQGSYEQFYEFLDDHYRSIIFPNLPCEESQNWCQRDCPRRCYPSDARCMHQCESQCIDQFESFSCKGKLTKEHRTALYRERISKFVAKAENQQRWILKASRSSNLRAYAKAQKENREALIAGILRQESNIYEHAHKILERQRRKNKKYEDDVMMEVEKFYLDPKNINSNPANPQIDLFC